MYLLANILLMAVLPVLSILVERHFFASPISSSSPGKWFVFWAVGVRTFLAGLQQTRDPGFTAGTIFAIKDKAAERLVAEIGFANLAIGLLGMVSIFDRAWVAPAAIVGCAFYRPLRFKHFFNPTRNQIGHAAMISDLIMFALLAVYLPIALLVG